MEIVSCYLSEKIIAHQINRAVNFKHISLKINIYFLFKERNIEVGSNVNLITTLWLHIKLFLDGCPAF